MSPLGNWRRWDRRYDLDVVVIAVQPDRAAAVVDAKGHSAPACIERRPAPVG